MSTLHLHFKALPGAPQTQLRDAVMHQSTGFWRIADENIADIDTICIWADADGIDLFKPVSYTASVTGWSDVQWTCGRSRIIRFCAATAALNLEPGEPPVFNRMGWAITHTR